MVADYYFARIDNTSFPNFRNNLFDYYIEATDARGNVSKSDIQHVFVADDAGGGGGGGGGTTTGPVVSSPSPPVAGQSVTITYSGTLASGTAVNIHYGYNGTNASNWTAPPGVAMTKSNSVWTFTYTVPSNATSIGMAFNFNGQDPWDNNNRNNYNFSVTNSPPANPPAVPTGLTAQGVATNSVSLSWDSMATASGYTVYRDGNLLASVVGTSYLDNSCLPETTYSYTVTADNLAGSSAPSLPASATTFFPALANYALRLVNPAFAINTTAGSFAFRGQAGSGLTNGLRWSNSLNGLTGTISFSGQTNSSGWAWSNIISLATGSNRITFSGDYLPPPVRTGQDSATNSGYSPQWTNGSSGGTGFGAWSFSNSPSAGFFRADATNSTNMNVGSSNGFGLYASGNGSARASRNLPTAMKSGDVLTLRFDNNWIDTGARVGMALLNASGVERLSFYFVGGSNNYLVDDSFTGRDTSWPYSGNGFLITFSLTDSNSYSMNIGSSSLTGNLAASGPITRVAVYNNNAGINTERNLYVGEMTFTESQSPGVTTLSAADVVYNPMTDGIPNSWWSQYFGTTAGVSASADSDGDGFTNMQEYALGTDPKSAASTFKVGEMTRSGGSLTITWPSVAGKRYQVQTAPQLSAGAWQNAGDVVAPSVSGTSSVTVSVSADAPACFVRVIPLP